MKLESAASAIVLVTGFWILCSFSYVYGVFLRYDTTLVGLLTLDEVISSSAGKISTVVTIVMPLTAMTIYIINQTFLKSSLFNNINLVSFFTLCAIGLALIGLYILFARGILSPPIDPGIPFIVLVSSAPAFLGTIFDRAKGGVSGRIAALVVTGVLASFALGSEPRFFPEAGRQKCVELYDQGEMQASGPLLYATPSSIIIKRADISGLDYYRTTETNRVSSIECKS